jgi:spore coat polysaccharide biosynthesis predicted glycosyltransferase SpsG
MNIQVEKIELIKRLADVNSEGIIKKLKAILIPEQKMNETERLMSNPALVKKVREARQEIKEGKGVKMDVKDLWK